MAKQFNTSVTCDPIRHYMVDTTAKMKVFERMIDDKKYFTINRARQFGKSTSLNWILHNMSQRYLVVPIDFENTSESNWLSEKSFYDFFCDNMIEFFEVGNCPNKQYADFWETAKTYEKPDFKYFASKVKEFCRLVPQRIVLTIDEVDKSLGNQLFLDFLAMLRKLYLDREKFGNDSLTFWSVVLAGVYDVKNLKIKIRPESEHQYNSPWNVAADYELDMTFNPQEISTMLADYENDYHIGFNINEISDEIFKYTSGYPVLVSALCKKIDENLDKDWTKDGVQKAVKMFIKDPDASILKTITRNIGTYPDLKNLLRAIVLENFKVSYYADNLPIDLARTFSFIRPDEKSKAQIHNLIFQQVLLDYFISEKQLATLAPDFGSQVFIDKNGDLNMPMIINRFKDLMSKKQNQEEFLEREGRFMFICFLKPIINGTGFYYSEPENDDGSRMDLVVTYNRKEYVIELKIWHGTEYEISGREQLSGYLATRNLSTGYLVTFSFLKNKVVQEKPEWIEHGGKKIYEAVI